MPAIYEDRIRRIDSRASLIEFLRDELNWPAPPDLAPDDMLYDWSAGELNIDEATAQRFRVQQLVDFRAGQPWGVFLLETASPQVYASHLRRVLRGLAPSARARSAHLPAWPAENLLFIATHKYQRFTFAHFEGEQAAKARLSTFGWDRDDTVGLRTLSEHNLPALAWPDDEQASAAWLAQWGAAFDVEAVTDKFFKEFRDCFEGTKDALARAIPEPSERHAFTQRLLNRLLFLCFLQKKRWLRAPELERPKTTYLFDLFDCAEAQGLEFYGDYLYDLFFNALNRPPQGVDEAERRRLELKLGTVPFLNGGLFDRVDRLDAPNAIKIPNAVLEPIVGHGGLLQRHNFTVTESTPLNVEVAVDPEMLGKVFETVVLTSEQSDDYQAPNLRKATGSYYTPRIVVTFIVREALKDYITARVPGLDKSRLGRLMELDAAGGLEAASRAELNATISQREAEAVRAQIENLRACDPAVGSGAFALGLLHELVNLNILCETVERGKDPRLSQPNLVFDLKKRIIERNIYGVDLQAKAAEICKLRLWLSLVVDYEAEADLASCTEQQFERAIARIPALPNLAYKIRRGDALLDLVRGRPFRMKEISHSAPMQEARAALLQAHHEFFAAQAPETKRRLRRDALAARTRLTRLQLESQLAEVQQKGAQLDLFDSRRPVAEIRALEAEVAALKAVLAEVEGSEQALAPLLRRAQLTEADDSLLTRLEASSEDEAITFTWELDFPEIFSPAEEGATVRGAMAGIVNQAAGQMELPARAAEPAGFDLIVGNPPFVTARNPERREQYRERWKETCYQKYQLVAPFFQRSFGLLKSGGHLGFIVSNAFAKREFGRPLVEHFFPTVQLCKVVDCSGLMFPGHGTPTFIVFAGNTQPTRHSTTRIAVTLPGGGDLRTPPERSSLWAAIESHHDEEGFTDSRIAVADRMQSEMATWPWNLDVSTDGTREAVEANHPRLEGLIVGDIGVCTMTNADDVFLLTTDFARRLGLPRSLCPLYHQGEEVRDWNAGHAERLLAPYDDKARLIPEPKLHPAALRYLRLFRRILEQRRSFGSKTFKQLGRVWYEFERMNATKYDSLRFLVFPMIATHQHFAYVCDRRLFGRHAQVVKLAASATSEDHVRLVGLLNSSVALFWLKQFCFSKRESGEPEADTYYEFAGGRVQQLPVAPMLLEPNELHARLLSLSLACHERGEQIPGLALRAIFERQRDAYHTWNNSLPGHLSRHSISSDSSLQGSLDLLSIRDAAVSTREHLGAEMIALQEEMDWLVYAAYGLLPLDHPAVGLHAQPELPEPLALGERPFELLRDGNPIPAHFSPGRQALWQARLQAIRTNEHIRRIEQPAYKRRWYRKETDEQEFRRAYEWWMLEKAEWWLEHQAKGGPVELDAWAAALWEDGRVRAAVEAVEGRLPNPAEFARLFRALVVESTVPDWIPPAMPWEQVAKKYKGRRVPARARRIRGKLNVPRERFRLTAEGRYVWAGKDIFGR